MSSISISEVDGICCGKFSAMASPCEVLVDTSDQSTAYKLVSIVADEAWRIEKKFSRYLPDNIIHKINNAQGKAITVDEETGYLLDFANTMYQISDGLFDISSGVLRKAWKFENKQCIPDAAFIQSLLPAIGWSKAQWNRPTLKLPPDMQIDLGGIGKEYAVDQSIQLLRQATSTASLVNFGGDISITGPRNNDQAWQIAIESVAQLNTHSGHVLALKKGAVATSGNSRQFHVIDGVRYGHILNPKTGWPIQGAPRSVTVAAGSCTEAGMLATLSMLQGEDCEKFLENEDVKFWALR